MAASWASWKYLVCRAFPTYRHISTKFEPAKRFSHFLVRSSNPISSCSVCKCQHFVNFHTSEIWYKRRKTKDERKVDRIIEYSPKRKKSDIIIDVWRNMKVIELANALGKDTEMLFEAMIYIEGTNAYDSNESVITDVNVIHEIVKKLGTRCRVVKAPLVQNADKVFMDVQKRDPPDPSVLVKRPPVVTVMGHVDHGKTTLLDTLRNTSVVSQEFGGITQHIGAFMVKLQDDKSVTFLDTPGHAAFYAMRARGALVTDIIVLVVAADDGVMQQTVESINHSRDANVPIIVAINKIDRPNANLENCKKGLLEHGIQLEDFGGDIQAVPISALKGTNVDLLVEAILTQAELMEYKGDPTGMVEGYIIESRTDPGRGKLSTALVKRGTLSKGAVLVAGTAWAKVRAMFDENGAPLQCATLSMPVEILGWRELPAAGDEIIEVENEAKASEVVRWRLKLKQEEKLAEDNIAIKFKLDEHLAKYRAERDQRRKLGYFRRRATGHRQKEIIDEDVGPRLQIILKGDVDGSVEAILDVLDSYSSQKCTLDIVHYGVGQVNDGDIELAAAFQSIVYAFNIKVPESVKKIAKKNDVEIKEFNIIYRLIDDVKEEITSRLPLKDEEEIYGTANVLEEFVVNERRKKVPIAGCKCDKGVLKRKGDFRVMRDDTVIHQGKLVSLRHLKNDVDTVNKGVDCGLRFEDETVRFQPGDRIVCYTMHKVPQKLNWDTGF